MENPPFSAPAPIGLHEGLRHAGAPGHDGERRDRQEIGDHQEELIGHRAAERRLKAELEAIEEGEQQGAEQRTARPP